MSSKYLAFLLIASLAMAATPPVLNAQPCGTGTNCRFVNPYATGDVDGLTWNTAYRDLQAALMAESTARTFWVRGETYYYPGTDRDDQFAVQAGDILYGGFAGNEDDLSDRPQPLLDTFLSGDFDGEPHGDNCFVLITMPQNNTSTVVDGFVLYRADLHAITCSNGASGQLRNLRFLDNVNPGGTGAALFIEDESSSLVRDCRFESNSAYLGGAVAMTDTNTNPRFTGCSFTANTARQAGAMYITGLAKPTLLGCSLQGNSALADSDDQTAPKGGAIYVEGASAVILDSDFLGNQANFTHIGELANEPAAGGAIRAETIVTGGEGLEVRRCTFFRDTVSNAENVGEGGGISVVGPARIIRCTFSEESVDADPGYGGATASAADAQFINCVYWVNRVNADGATVPDGYGGAAWVSDATTEFTNCLMYDNTARFGGGIAGGDGAAFTAINCTVVRNTAWELGGGVYVADEGPAALNCIFWKNCAQPICEDPNQDDQIYGPLGVDYSDIQGCGGLCSTGHNISEPPDFVDDTSLETPDFRLNQCSKCIDAASTPDTPQDGLDIDEDSQTNCSVCSATTGERTPDLDLKRRVEDSFVADTGVADDACPPCITRVVDMGAYEWHDCGGDLLDDDDLNGLDIPPFVACLLAGPDITPGCLCADLNHDGQITFDGDLDCFVTSLVSADKVNACAGTGTCTSGFIVGTDCNQNEVPDVSDVYRGTSQDCNGNFIPDECDIASDYSADLNEDGIPDECQPDCNSNAIPDDKDIADETSADINSNGVPDECDADCDADGEPDDYEISENGAPDCNLNGIPDGCEPDCNENGVPDDCDIDPTDPDGDEFVSEDCNGNEFPDECDLAYGPVWGSADCNENGVPDECDIADCHGDPACDDCNANGVPDACDIAAQISADDNSNGIPDECENILGGGGNAPQGPGGSEPEAPAPGSPEWDAAWEEFFEWTAEQTWGPTSEYTGAQQFQRYVDKLAELGLPFPMFP